MNLSFEMFIALMILWLCLCCLCGFRRRFVLFLGLVFFGMSSISIWLSAALKVGPFEAHAVNAQASGLTCAGMAFVIGLFLSRLHNAWLESRVEDSGV